MKSEHAHEGTCSLRLGWIPVHTALQAFAPSGPGQLFEFSSDIFASSMTSLHALEQALSCPRPRSATVLCHCLLYALALS